MRFESSDFQHGKPIPKRFTGEGQDLSPPLAWSYVPEGTQELALVCEDPDAPTSKPFLHWLLYDIPASVKSLREGDWGGAKQGRNDFGRTGYGGPMPPPGSGPHRYRFKLYALKEHLGLGRGTTREELQAAMQGKVLAEAELVGTYERK